MFRGRARGGGWARGGGFAPRRGTNLNSPNHQANWGAPPPLPKAVRASNDEPTWDSSMWGTSDGEIANAKEKVSNTLGSGGGGGGTGGGGWGNSGGITRESDRGGGGGGWGVETDGGGWGGGWGGGGGGGWGGDSSSRDPDVQADISPPLLAAPEKHDWSQVTSASRSKEVHRAASPSVTETSTGASLARQPGRRTSFTQSDRHYDGKDAVQIMTRCVRLNIEFDDLSEKLDRWKRTQASEAFHKVGALGKEKLDGIRAEYHKKLDTLQKQRDRLFASLLDLREKPRSLPGLGPDFDIEKVHGYTAELLEWIQESRPCLLEITRGEPSSAPSQPPAEMGGSENRSVIPHSEQLRSSAPTATPTESLRTRIDTMKNRIDEIEGDIYIAYLTNINEDKVGEMVQDTFESRNRGLELEEGECDSNNTSPNSAQPAGRYNELLQRTHALDYTLREQSTMLAAFVLNEKEREAELVALRTEHDQFRASNAQMQSEFGAIRLELSETSKHVQQLSDQILALHSQPSRREGTPPALITQELLTQVESSVDDNLRRDIFRVFEELKAAVSDQVDSCNREIYEEIWAQIRPALHMVDAIQSMAESSVQA